MASQDVNKTLEQLVKERVEAELSSLPIDIRESRTGTKSTKEAIATIMPSIANIISVAVSTAVSTAVKDLTEKLITSADQTQRTSLLHRYESDRQEQYTRRDNLRIFGIAEEPDEDEDTLEGKIIEVAADVGVTLEPNDISIAHRLGRPGGRDRPVIVRFCHRKKRNQVIRNKKELKRKQKDVYINEDLTSMRAAMLKMVKSQTSVKNVTTKDGNIFAWLNNKDRPVEITSPDDLHKVGITSPDWKLLKLDHIVQ